MGKTAVFFILLVLFTGVAAAADPGVDRAEQMNDRGLVDMVLAAVDGEPVTLNDLKRWYETRGETFPEDASLAERRNEVREMVTDALVSREAKAAGISVSGDEVDAYIAEIKRQNNLDDQAFAEALRKKRLALETYKEQVRNDIIRARLIGTRVRAKVNVLDNDVNDFLKKHPDLRPRHGTVHLEQILLPLDPHGADPRKRARRIREEILDGKSFEEAGGEYYSDLGFMKVEDLRPELQRGFRGLRPGHVSEVLETKEGLLLFTFSKAADEESEVDPKLKSQIQNEIYQSRFKEQMEKYLNEDLPKKYHVEYKI